MNPKYAPTFIIGGLVLSIYIGSSIIRYGKIIVFLPFVIFAIISIGYGLKIRKENKQPS